MYEKDLDKETLTIEKNLLKLKHFTFEPVVKQSSDSGNLYIAYVLKFRRDEIKDNSSFKNAIDDSVFVDYLEKHYDHYSFAFYDMPKGFELEPILVGENQDTIGVKVSYKRKELRTCASIEDALCYIDGEDYD